MRQCPENSLTIFLIAFVVSSQLFRSTAYLVMRHAAPNQVVRSRPVEIMLRFTCGFVHRLSIRDAIQSAKGPVAGTAAHSKTHWQIAPSRRPTSVNAGDRMPGTAVVNTIR
jgi:hypothetical protein